MYCLLFTGCCTIYLCVLFISLLSLYYSKKLRNHSCETKYIFLNTHMGWMHTQQLREVLANHLNKIISKMEDSIYSPVLL